MTFLLILYPNPSNITENCIRDTYVKKGNRSSPLIRIKGEWLSLITFQLTPLNYKDTMLT